AAVVALWPRPTPPGASWANVERVENGMTRAEVEAIIGPPGDYRAGPTNYEPAGISRGVIIEADERLYAWAFDDYFLTARYDASGRLERMMYQVVCSPAEESRAGDFAWQLKRQWRRWFPE